MRNIRATLLRTSRACRSLADFHLKKRREQCYFIEAQVGVFYLLFGKSPVRSINVCFQFSVKFLDSSYSHHRQQMGHRYPST